MSRKHALAGVIGERHRQVFDGIVDQITVGPGEEYGLQLMPPKNVPASILIHQKIAGFGGLTGERAYEEKGKAINSGSAVTKFFSPGSYQEHVRYGEQDLLFVAKLGTIGERGITGLTGGELDYMARDAAKLELRIKNRMQKLAWDSLFLGTYTWKSQVVDFAIPGANVLTATTDWSIKSTATPLEDLWILQSTNATLIKYKIKEFVINPKTAADMLVCDEVRNVLKNYNIAANDINVVAKFLFPGLAPIKVVSDAYQDETLAADKSIVVGAVQFFVPNDKVLVVPDFGGKLCTQFGEFQIAENMNAPGASSSSPAQGIYTFVDEKGLEEHESPYVKLIAGFNGAPNLKRSDDVIVISV